MFGKPMDTPTKRRMASVAGVLLVLLGAGFLVFLRVVWDTAYRMVSLFGGPVETSMTLEAWGYVLGGVTMVVVGLCLAFCTLRTR